MAIFKQYLAFFKTHSLEVLAVLFVFSIAAWIRLENLSANPAWYTDETAHVDIAHNLLNGEIRYMAVQESVLLFARPPIFHIFLAGAFAIFGTDIFVLRLLTVICSLVAIGLLWWWVRRYWQLPILAWLAALMLAIYPDAAVYSRFGFSYNLTVCFLLLSVILIHHYRETDQRLAWGAFIFGIGLITDVVMLSFMLPFLLWVPRQRIKALIMLSVPPLIYAGLMVVTSPHAFWHDLVFTFGRTQSGAVADQWQVLRQNVMYFDMWMAMGMIGITFLPKYRLAALLLWVPFLIMARTIPLYSLTIYYRIPLYPFVALGGAVIVWWSYLGIKRLTNHQWLGLIAIAVFAIGLTYAQKFPDRLQDGWVSPHQALLIPAEDAQAVADYLNPILEPSDRVVVSSPIGWLLDANTIEFSMGAAIQTENGYTIWGDVHLTESRFHHSPLYQEAQYVVIDTLWWNWGGDHIPLLPEMLMDIQDHWDLIFESGQVQVYQNPNMKDM